MNPFNYFMVPTASFPPLYYFPTHTSSILEVQPPLTVSTIPSETNIRPAISTSSAVVLNREDLLEAGY